MSKPEALVQYFDSLPEKNAHDIMNKRFINRMLKKEIRPELKSKLILTYMINDKLRSPNTPAPDWAAYGTARDYNAAVDSAIKDMAPEGVNVNQEMLDKLHVSENIPKSDMAPYTSESTNKYYRGPTVYIPTNVGNKLLDSIISEELPAPKDWEDWISNKHRAIVAKSNNKPKEDDIIANAEKWKGPAHNISVPATKRTAKYESAMKRLELGKEAYYKSLRDGDESLTAEEDKLADEYVDLYNKCSAKLYPAIQNVQAALNKDYYSNDAETRRKTRNKIDSLGKILSDVANGDFNGKYERGVQNLMEKELAKRYGRVAKKKDIPETVEIAPVDWKHVDQYGKSKYTDDDIRSISLGKIGSTIEDLEYKHGYTKAQSQAQRLGLDEIKEE